MQNNQETELFRALCDAVFDDRATQEQLDQLESLVLSSPDLKRKYVELAHQHASLSWSTGEHAQLVGPPVAAGGSSTSSNRTAGWLSSWGVAAVALASVLVMAAVSTRFPRDEDGAAVAELIQTRNCAWRDTVLPTTEGSRLLPGRMILSEGLATIRFDHGVAVAVEAPADFEVISKDSMRLYTGRLVATADPGADGFAVLTPTAELVDRGTVFGVSVADSGESDVIVFEGLVDARLVNTGKQQRLKKGERLRTSSQEMVAYEAGTHGLPERLRSDSRIVQISTAVGRGQDTYVQRTDADDGHNSSSMILVKNCISEWPEWDRNPKDWDRKGWLRFDLSFLERQTVESAELRLYFAPTGFGFASRVPDATFAVYGVTDEELDEWSEAGLSWENAVANLDGSAEVDMDAARLLGRFIIPQGQASGTFGVQGESLLELIQRDTNNLLTIIVVRETTSSKVGGVVHGFASRRHPELSPPTLRVTTRPESD